MSVHNFKHLLLNAVIAALLQVALCAAAYTDDCPANSAPLAKLGTLAPVVEHMSSLEKMNLTTECADSSKSSADVENCLKAVNQELYKRYGGLSQKIATSLKSFDTFLLPKNADGTLNCGNLPKYTKNGKPTAGTPVLPAYSEPLHLPYHIAPPDSEEQQAAVVKLSRALKLDSIADPALTKASVALSLGRGTAADYQKAIQRLACVSGNEFQTKSGAQAAIAKAGLGIDCAGAVQLMLRDAAMVGDNSQLGLASPAFEGFKNELLVKNKKFFTHSLDPLTIRPGDVIPLGQPDKTKVGHVVIAQEVSFDLAKRVATATSLKSSFETQPGDKLMTVKVASSWGGQGPELLTWVYNMRTAKWAAENKDGSYSFDVSGPYNHPYTGQYHSNELTP